MKSIYKLLLVQSIGFYFWPYSNVLDCKKKASNVDTNVPSNIGRHEPSDSGVAIQTDVQLSTRGILCAIKKLYYGLRLKIFK